MCRKIGLLALEPQEQLFPALFMSLFNTHLSRVALPDSARSLGWRKGPRRAESWPPPTPCRCQQNSPFTGRAASAPHATPESTKTQPGLPPSSISLLSFLAEPTLSASLGLRHVCSQFLPPIPPIVHPQPLRQGSAAPNLHPALTPEPGTTNMMLWRRQSQGPGKSFQLAVEDVREITMRATAPHHLQEQQDRESLQQWVQSPVRPDLAPLAGAQDGSPGAARGRCPAGKTPRWVQPAPSSTPRRPSAEREAGVNLSGSG